MAKHHILAVFALSLLTRSLPGAEVKLGPEIPLAPAPELRSAAYNQTSPAAASNGGDYLVAWADGRRLGSDIYVTRVGSDGLPTNATGRRIAEGKNPKIATAGGDYILVWQGSSNIRSLRVNTDGVPVAESYSVGSGEPVALVSNGSTYLLVNRAAGSTTQSSAVLLDRDGVPLRTLATAFARVLGVGSYGGRYYLVDLKASGQSMTLHAIGDDGAVTDQAIAVSGTTSEDRVTAAFAPARILLAWSTGRTIVAGYDGRIIREQTVPLNGAEGAVAAGWDGREFLVTFTSESPVDPGARAFRVSFDGTPAGPLALSKLTQTSVVCFASNALSQLIVWSEFREFTSDIVARKVPEFGALPADAVPATLLSYSGEAQTDVQIARGPRGTLAVWGDGDRWLRVSASFNGGPPVVLQSDPGPDYIGWPAVAAGNQVFLVVWRYASIGGGPDRIVGTRFDFDGKALDTHPMLLTSADHTDLHELQQRPQTPSLTFNGSSFLVAWADTNELYFARLGESGPLLAEWETAVGSGLSNAIRSPRVFWTGSDFLIGFTLESYSSINFLPPSWSLGTVRVDRAGTTLTQASSSFFNALSSADVHLAATTGPDAVTFAWSDNGIAVAQTTLDGKAKVSPVVVIPRATTDGPSTAEIAWNGSEYVLVWLERIAEGGRGYTVKAIRLDERLQRLDLAPFEVTSGPVPLLPPWLIATPTGVLITYSRADDANGGAPRAFMRALERIPKPPHRRAVGR
jgi:hypothetical protein